MRLLPAIAFAAYLLLPVVAQAEPVATVEITVVSASKQEGPTDPRVAPMRSLWGDFAYRSFKVLSQQQIDVTLGGTREVSLPNGKTLTVTFSQRDKDGGLFELSIPSVTSVKKGLRPDGKYVATGGSSMPYDGGDLFVPVKLVRVK